MSKFLLWAALGVWLSRKEEEEEDETFSLHVFVSLFALLLLGLMLWTLPSGQAMVNEAVTVECFGYSDGNATFVTCYDNI